MEELPGISVTWIPVLQICVLCLGTLASFITAYFAKAVTIYLPYISETGGWPPESCIFTLTLICGSFLGILVVIVRYLIVEDLSKQQDGILTLNRKGLYVGLLSWCGLLVVGAFPMSTVLSAHLLGAGTHFALGLAYVFLQTAISHKLIPVGTRHHVIVKIRISLCLLLLIFLAFLLITFPVAQFNWRKNNGEHYPALKTPKDSGFGLIITSSFFEWGLYVVFLSYFATFTVEFKNYRLLTSVLKISATKSEESVNQDRINDVT